MNGIRIGAPTVALAAIPLPGTSHVRRLRADCGYSNAKIFFQSSFMLMTVHPLFFASS
jgi:hypothetical protein